MPRKIDAIDRKKFMDRLLAIDACLPDDYVNKAILIKPNLNVNRLQNVRYNKTICFEYLEILEEIAGVAKEKLEK